MLTAAQVRDQLGISERTLRRLISSGDLPAVRLGTSGTRGIRISEEALAQFLEDRKVVPSQAAS